MDVLTVASISLFKIMLQWLGNCNCHRKNGPGKNGLAGMILDENLIRADHFWLTKNGVAEPILANKSDLARLKMV